MQKPRREPEASGALPYFLTSPKSFLLPPSLPLSHCGSVTFIHSACPDR